MANTNIKNNLVYLSTNITDFPMVIAHLIQEGIFEDAELTAIENDMKANGTAQKLFRELMKKQLEAKLSTVIDIFKSTGNEHLAKKIEGSNMTLVQAEVNSDCFFNCEFLELCNCDFIKDGEKVEVADLSISIGDAVKVLKIVCDEGKGTQVDINLNCLSSMECVNLRRVRLVIESLIKKMDNVREIDFDLVAFIRQHQEVDVLINEFVNFERLRKLSLKGKNMSVDLSGLSINAELHGTKVVSVKNPRP